MNPSRPCVISPQCTVERCSRMCMRDSGTGTTYGLVKSTAYVNQSGANIGQKGHLTFLKGVENDQ